MSLKRAQDAELLVKDAVFGYIKGHEKEKGLNVPAIVKYLCLNYYLLEEHFTIGKNYGCGYPLDDTRRLATVICRDGERMVFGDFNILSNDTSMAQYQWRFQFPDFRMMNGITIGIDFGGNSYCGLLTRDFPDRMSFRFAKRSWTGTMWRIPTPDHHQLDPDFDAERDYIDMFFDPISKVLSFPMNDQKICKWKINESLDGYTETHMVVGFGRHKSCSIRCKLVQFRVHHK